MINSAINPDDRLYKRHNILSFHFFRMVIVANYINLQHLRSKINITNVVSKNWSYQSVYKGLLKPRFCFEGDLLYVNNYINVEENNVLVIDGEW